MYYGSIHKSLEVVLCPFVRIIIVGFLLEYIAYVSLVFLTNIGSKYEFQLMEDDLYLIRRHLFP